MLIRPGSGHASAQRDIVGAGTGAEERYALTGREIPDQPIPRALAVGRPTPGSRRQLRHHLTWAPPVAEPIRAPFMQLEIHASHAARRWAPGPIPKALIQLVADQGREAPSQGNYGAATPGAQA